MDEFVPLHALLRKAPASLPTAEPECVPDPESPPEMRDALGEVRRFRAALADAFDVALERLLYDVATDVVARELQLDGVGIASIVRAALSRYENEWPLRVRVHPDDAFGVTNLDVPLSTDDALRRGDIAIDLRSGTIDLSLGTRLEGALRALVS